MFIQVYTMNMTWRCFATGFFYQLQFHVFFQDDHILGFIKTVPSLSIIFVFMGGEPGGSQTQAMLPGNLTKGS